MFAIGSLPLAVSQGLLPGSPDHPSMIPTSIFGGRRRVRVADFLASPSWAAGFVQDLSNVTGTPLMKVYERLTFDGACSSAAVLTSQGAEG